MQNCGWLRSLKFIRNLPNPRPHISGRNKIMSAPQGNGTGALLTMSDVLEIWNPGVKVRSGGTVRPSHAERWRAISQPLCLRS